MYNSQQPQLYGVNRQQQQLHQIQQGPAGLQGNMGYVHPMGVGTNNMNLSSSSNGLRNPVMMGAPAGLGASDLLSNNMVYKQNNPTNLSGLGATFNNTNIGPANNSTSAQSGSFQVLGNPQFHPNTMADSLNLESLNINPSINLTNQATSSAMTDSNENNENKIENETNVSSAINQSSLDTKADGSSNTPTDNSTPTTSTSASSANTSATTNTSTILTTRQTSDDDKVFTWILELMHGPNSEQALLELGKKREQYEDLALILWHSFGVMTCLLQEIIYVYPLLSPPQLTSTASNRVCNALALLQCIASHDSTRQPFLNAHIPLFLYPFLNTTSKSRSFEYLRLTSLGVIGALVKNDSPEVINFLLTTEIIPLCLRIMESGTELSKTVAIFILQKILMDDEGLRYICQTYERFMAVSNVLSNIVEQLVGSPTARLLKHVVRCYLRLSDNDRACHELKSVLPEPLRDGTFSRVLRDDGATKRCLAQLLKNLSDNNGQQQLQSMQ